MDVLVPSLVWVDGACYRFFESNFWSNEDCNATTAVEDSDIQEFNEVYSKELDGCDTSEFDDGNGREFHVFNTLEYTDSNTLEYNDTNTQKYNDVKKEHESDVIDLVPMHKCGFVHRFTIDERFYPIIVGANGDVKKKIEWETDTSIKVPRMYEGEKVEIKGLTEEAVVLARRRIDHITKTFRGVFHRKISTDLLSAKGKSVSGLLDANVKSSTGPLHENVKRSAGPLDVKVKSSTGLLNSKIKSSNGSVDVRVKSSNGPSHGVLETSSGLLDAKFKTSRGSLEAKNKISGPPLDGTIKSYVRPSVWSRKPFTHFISIPMINETITSNCVKFKNVLLKASGGDYRGIREEIFRKPEKMHIPLGMLSLTNDRTIKRAMDALEECKQNIIKPVIDKMGPIKMKAQGLKCLAHNPCDINVLYCHVLTENNVLQKIGEQIADFFTRVGLMEESHKKLDIHMTLMNVRFDKKCPDKKFYAKNLLTDHSDYFFGEKELRTILISERHNYSQDGYYVTTAKIDIP